MQKTRPFIAILLLTVYFITVLLPAGDFSLASSKGISKSCKKENVISDTYDLQNIFTKKSLNTSDGNNANIPQTQLLTSCSQSVVYLASVSTEIFTKVRLQEPEYAIFSASLYSSLSKGIDPDPPKNSFC